MTAREPATTRPALRLTLGELAALMRRSYQAPLPPPVPLHQMAKARKDLADEDQHNKPKASA